MLPLITQDGRTGALCALMAKPSRTHSDTCAKTLRLWKRRDVLVWEKEGTLDRPFHRTKSSRSEKKTLENKVEVQCRRRHDCQMCQTRERRVCCKLQRFLTIGRDWWNCREARAHQSAEHDLRSVPPCDFPAASPNLLPNLCSSVSAARTKPQRGAGRGGEEAGDERGRRGGGSHAAFNFAVFSSYNLDVFSSIIWGY